MIKIFKKREKVCSTFIKRSGFALLFAVFTASILMLIGVSIFSVSLRELAISQSAKDSQLAFYAADSARECALYWDIKKAAFPFCLGSGCNPKNEGLDNITCGIMNFNPMTKSVYNGDNTYTFGSDISPFFKYGDDTKPMADLVLTIKFNTTGPDAGNVTKQISTQGHNTGPSGRRLERGIIQTY